MHHGRQENQVFRVLFLVLDNTTLTEVSRCCMAFKSSPRDKQLACIQAILIAVPVNQVGLHRAQETGQT